MKSPNRSIKCKLWVQLAITLISFSAFFAYLYYFKLLSIETYTVQALYGLKLVQIIILLTITNYQCESCCKAQFMVCGVLHFLIMAFIGYWVLLILRLPLLYEFIAAQATSLLLLIIDIIIVAVAYKQKVNSQDLKESLKAIEKRLVATDNKQFYKYLEQQCTICYGDFKIGEKVVFAPCHYKHQFHAQCLLAWLKTKKCCPYCNAEITSDAIDAKEGYDISMIEQHLILEKYSK